MLSAQSAVCHLTAYVCPRRREHTPHLNASPQINILCTVEKSTSPFYIFILIWLNIITLILANPSAHATTSQSPAQVNDPGFINHATLFNPTELSDFRALTQDLIDAKRKEVTSILDSLAQKLGNKSYFLFENYLEGRLFYEAATNHIFTLFESPTGEHTYKDILTGHTVTQDQELEEHIKLIKLPSNNRIRKHLRTLIARIELSHQDPDIRLDAVLYLLKHLDETDFRLLNKRLSQEPSSLVRDKIALALNIASLEKKHPPEETIKTIELLSGNLDPLIKIKLTEIINDPQSKYLPANTGRPEDNPVIAAAKNALNQINQKVRFYATLEQIYFGLSLGSILCLAAIGLAITFGVMGVINMAHGEMMMLGAYTTYAVQQALPNHIEYSIWIALPCAFIISGSVGILIERGIIRFLHGRPLETLLTTFGLSLILQQLVRTVFSPLNQQIISPSWMSGSWQINPVFSLTYNRLYILIFTFMVFALLHLILKRTSLGLQVRAVSQNRNMARAMGVKTAWVDALTFGLGSGIAGIAGVALSQLTNVGPNLGQAYIVDSFMVVVFGGVGNLLGTLLGGFTLGIGNKLLEPATGAVLANIFMLCFIVIFIQRQPNGLFPQKGRAPE